MAEGPASAAGQVAPVAALLHGTEMLAMFLSLMPDAAVAVNTSGTIVAVNERTEAMFGYETQDLEGKPIELLVPERYRHGHRTDRAEYSAAPHARPMGAGLDLYARRKDGSEFPVDISLAPIGGTEMPLVVAAVRDITERKAAQSAQAQLAAIVESSADGIFSMTQHGLITSWNPGAQAMFGFDRRQVLGHHLSHFFPDDPVLEELMSAARNGLPSPSQDTCWTTSDGRPIDVAISVSPVNMGNERGFSVLVRDITARKQSEAQLRHQALWQTATAEIRLKMLSDEPLGTTLTLVCRWAGRLSGARSAALVMTDGPTASLGSAVASGPPLVSVAASAGVPEDAVVLSGLTELPAVVADAVTSGAARAGHLDVLPGLVAQAFPVMLPTAPGPTGSRGRNVAPERAGALLILADEGHTWDADQEEVMGSLAASALLALELADVRSERDRLLISADRERIARDLHDLVIQRLFGAGLRLQGALALIDSPPAAARVTSTIDDLDTTIKEIREAIFALESAPGAGLKAKVDQTAAGATEALGFRPSVVLQGAAVDVPLQVQIEAAAVLREALTNAARHARASRVDVLITVGPPEGLTVLVTDNGSGIGQPGRLSGIANARARAELLGGRLDVWAPPEGGTRFEWCVPLP